MPTPIIELADEVAAQLSNASGHTFERRNGPYLKRDQLKDAKWLVVAAGDESEIKGRGVDRSTLTSTLVIRSRCRNRPTNTPTPLRIAPGSIRKWRTSKQSKPIFGPMENCATSRF